MFLVGEVLVIIRVLLWMRDGITILVLPIACSYWVVFC